MRITAIGPVLAIIVAPVALASCVATAPTASLHHQEVCAQYSNYEECLQIVADAIQEAEREADIEYGFVPGNIFWDCEIEPYFETFRVYCVGTLE